MAGKRLTVVIAQAQGKNPAKLQLEEDLAAALVLSGEVDCSVVPHLYDMSREHTGLLFLRSVPGDLVVLPYNRYVVDTVRLEIRDGFVRKIEGGLDARLMSHWLDGNKKSEGDLDGRSCTIRPREIKTTRSLIVSASS